MAVDNVEVGQRYQFNQVLAVVEGAAPKEITWRDESSPLIKRRTPRWFFQQHSHIIRIG